MKLNKDAAIMTILTVISIIPCFILPGYAVGYIIGLASIFGVLALYEFFNWIFTPSKTFFADATGNDKDKT